VSDTITNVTDDLRVRVLYQNK